MSAPLIHTQVDRRDGEDVWFRFNLSQLPAVPWKLHFCLARHIDPGSVEGGALERQSGSYKVLVPHEGVSELRFCCRNTPIKRYSDLPQGFFLSLTDEGAQPLHAGQQPFLRQVAQRAVDGHAADREFLQQPVLGRDLEALRPVAGADAAADGLLDLGVARLGGRDGVAHGASPGISAAMRGARTTPPLTTAMQGLRPMA